MPAKEAAEVTAIAETTSRSTLSGMPKKAKHLEMITNSASAGYTKPKYSLTLHAASIKNSGLTNCQLHQLQQKAPLKHMQQARLLPLQNTPFPLRNHLKVLKLTPATNNANLDLDFDTTPNQNLSSPTRCSLKSATSSSSPSSSASISLEHNVEAAVSAANAAAAALSSTTTTNLNANDSMNIRNQQQNNRLWYHWWKPNGFEVGLHDYRGNIDEVAAS